MRLLSELGRVLEGEADVCLHPSLPLPRLLQALLELRNNDIPEPLLVVARADCDQGVRAEPRVVSGPLPYRREVDWNLLLRFGVHVIKVRRIVLAFECERTVRVPEPSYQLDSLDE